MNKLWTIYAWLTMTALFVLIFFMAFWELYPYKPIEFSKTPLPILNKTVKQGEVLQYETVYCKFNELIPTATKIFKDGIIYNTPAQLVLAKKPGCADTFVGIEIPKALPPGHYTLEIIYSYKVNPIRIVNVIVETEAFDVIK